MSDVNKTLKQYNTSLPKTDPVDKDRNFGRPPITTGKNASTKMDGWRGNSDFGNIMNGTNGVNWNNKYTKWDVNSNPGGGANKAASIFNGIAMGLGAATTGLSIFGGIKAITDSNKAAKTNAKQEAAASYNPENEATIMDACNVADSFDSKSDITQMQTTNSVLMSQIQKAKDNRTLASGAIDTAKATFKNNETAFKGAEIERIAFDDGKNEVNGQITSLGKELAQLENVDTSKMDSTQKAAHLAKINELKSKITELETKLKTEFSDSKREIITKKINQYTKGMADSTTAISENTALVAKITSEINTAEKSSGNLHKKIKNHKDYE